MDEHSGRTSREPWLAVNLSAFLPGLGQIYTGKILRGALLAAVGAVTWVTSSWLVFSASGNAVAGLILLLPLVGFQFWSTLDAHRCASHYNSEGFELERKQTRDAWLAAFLSRIWPGLGHFYLRRFGPGIVLMILTVVIFAFATIPYGWVLGVMFIGFSCYRAYMAAPVRREKSKTPVACLLLLIYVQSAFLGWVPQTYQAFRIPTSSMEPTIRINDLILVRKSMDYQPERGDVIVFQRPDMGKAWIKRVVALGGESVAMEDGKLYIDGAELGMKPYMDLSPDELARYPGSSEFSSRVPSGHVFVLGDNIANSADSRNFGPIPAECIIGRAFKIYWPPDHAGPLQ